jgi:hypothetical protein
MTSSIILWGRHPNYANHQWIKLALDYDFHEYTYREKLGFELAYLCSGADPNAITYKPGHPWYFRHGGRIPFPREILESVKESGYEGYNPEGIKRADNLPEPKRSETLRQLREAEVTIYKRDLARYRSLAFRLKMARKNGTPIDGESINDDVCLNLSLKFSHLFNDLAHLVLIEERLSQQLDLFG